jgi:Xaa-Pro aminopeptidase/Xaa-Pro dipeptidase
VDHGLRRRTLAARLEELEIDALVVRAPVNVRYLTGFTGSSAAIVLDAQEAVFLTDGRYTEQARHEVPDLERRPLGEDPAATIAGLVAERGLARLGIEAEHTSVAAHRRLAEQLAGIDVVPVEGAVEELREVKDPEELDALARAQTATDAAFDRLLEVIELGVSEARLADLLAEELRQAGDRELAFEPIVAFGEQAAEPHHRAGHRLLEEGDVIVLDFGATWAGYRTDMTRTVAFGSPAAELRKIHDVVRQAQQAAIDAVRPGAAAGDLDEVARQVIAEAGYGERFDHGLGHGVGLEIHEAPWLRRGSTRTLRPGTACTIEPGVYVPGLGGVRIEDVVVVTDDGPRVLGTSSRELIEL